MSVSISETTFATDVSVHAHPGDCVDVHLLTVNDLNNPVIRHTHLHATSSAASTNNDVIPGEPYCDLSVDLSTYGMEPLDSDCFFVNGNSAAAVDIVEHLTETDVLLPVENTAATYGYRNKVHTRQYSLRQGSQPGTTLNTHSHQHTPGAQS